MTVFDWYLIGMAVHIIPAILVVARRPYWLDAAPVSNMYDALAGAALVCFAAIAWPITCVALVIFCLSRAANK